MATTTSANYKPTQIGQPIYADKNGVRVYRSPSVTDAFLAVRNKNDNPEFKKGTLFAEYLGESTIKGTKTWFRVKWIHRYKQFMGIFKWNQMIEETLEGWVLGDEITTLSDAEKTANEDAQFQKTVDELTKKVPDTDTDTKGTLAAAFALLFGGTNQDGTPKSTNQSLMYIVIILVSGGLGYWYFKRRKKLNIKR